ncbi:MAG: hypothetical protein ABIU05_11275 [Nitrospirales bacterium]
MDEDRIGSTAYLDKQRFLRRILNIGEHLARDAGAEEDRVDIAGNVRFDYFVLPVTKIEDVEVVARSTVVDIVAGPTNQLICTLIAPQQIVTGFTNEHIVPGIANQPVVTDTPCN